MVKYDITPFKFVDIVTKMEKDLVKLAFLAIKGNFITFIVFKRILNKSGKKEGFMNNIYLKLEKLISVKSSFVD